MHFLQTMKMISIYKMKYLKSRVGGKNTFKNEPRKKTIEQDLFKWIALVITLIGIFAWVAGSAYDQGYWDATAWGGALSRKTVQDIAFDGFAGPMLNWIVAFLLVAGGVAYVFLMEYLSTFNFSKKNLARLNFLKIKNGLSSEGKLVLV